MNGEMQISVEEFARLPASNIRRELVDGRVFEMNVPNLRHGEVCMTIAAMLWRYVRENRLGRVTGNNSGIITHRHPDSVRGPDIAFFSTQRFADAPLPAAYAEVPPELVVEVLSPNELWTDVMNKAIEFLHAGVTVVCVVDPERQTITKLRENRQPKLLHAGDEFHLPDVLGEFRVTVGDFFA